MMPEWNGTAWEPPVDAPIPRYQYSEVVTYNFSHGEYHPEWIARFRVQRIRWEEGQIRYGGPNHSGYGMRGRWTSATETQIDACQEGTQP
jgi:hypothetical protein